MRCALRLQLSGGGSGASGEAAAVAPACAATFGLKPPAAAPSRVTTASGDDGGQGGARVGSLETARSLKNSLIS